MFERNDSLSNGEPRRRLQAKAQHLLQHETNSRRTKIRKDRVKAAETLMLLRLVRYCHQVICIRSSDSASVTTSGVLRSSYQLPPLPNRLSTSLSVHIHPDLLNKPRLPPSSPLHSNMLLTAPRQLISPQIPIVRRKLTQAQLKLVMLTLFATQDPVQSA